MAYTVNNDIVTLDSGETVLVAITRSRLSNGGGLAFTAKATWIDEEGAPHSDDVGEINSETTFTVDSGTVVAFGEDALAKELLLAVLGEPGTLNSIVFSDEYRANISIRNHIALATNTLPSASSLL